MSDETGQEAGRLSKLQELQRSGRDPFSVHNYSRTHTAEQLAEGYEQLEGTDVAVCGRLMARREHGKSMFVDVVDVSGRIQVYAKLDELGEEAFAGFRDLDLGDIIGARGELFRTRSEEVTVRAKEWTLLAKCLHPLPETWHGLQDVEMRYRQRHLDLMVSPETRELFAKRARIMQATREFLCGRDFHEVETPVLQPLYGGANARPFTTHHNALDMKLYMRIAPELYLKRLVVGGMERVFEVAKVFRNEGIDTSHSPEYTLLEAYQAYTDYEGMMELIESLVCAMAQAANGSLQFTFDGNEIDLTPPWKRITLLGAIQEATGVDVSQIETDDEAREACTRLGLGEVEGDALPYLIDKAFDRHVQPGLIQPTFVVDYPLAISPLAKRKPGEPQLAARFEPFIGGAECGNAFSELNDPVDQRQRFEAQAEAKQAGDDEAHPLDEDFIRTLEYAMPPTGGLGLGMDRLVMLLCDKQSIREVILFPVMRPVQAQE